MARASKNRVGVEGGARPDVRERLGGHGGSGGLFADLHRLEAGAGDDELPDLLRLAVLLVRRRRPGAALHPRAGPGGIGEGAVVDDAVEPEFPEGRGANLATWRSTPRTPEGGWVPGGGWASGGPPRKVRVALSVGCTSGRAKDGERVRSFAGAVGPTLSAGPQRSPVDAAARALSGALAVPQSGIRPALEPAGARGLGVRAEGQLGLEPSFRGPLWPHVKRRSVLRVGDRRKVAGSKP